MLDSCPQCCVVPGSAHTAGDTSKPTTVFTQHPFMEPAVFCVLPSAASPSVKRHPVERGVHALLLCGVIIWFPDHPSHLHSLFSLHQSLI